MFCVFSDNYKVTRNCIQQAIDYCLLIIFIWLIWMMSMLREKSIFRSKNSPHLSFWISYSFICQDIFHAKRDCGHHEFVKCLGVACACSWRILLCNALFLSRICVLEYKMLIFSKNQVFVSLILWTAFWSQSHWSWPWFLLFSFIS
jgi:hypothetical protein